MGFNSVFKGLKAQLMGLLVVYMAVYVSCYGSNTRWWGT